MAVPGVVVLVGVRLDVAVEVGVLVTDGVAVTALATAVTTTASVAPGPRNSSN